MIRTKLQTVLLTGLFLLIFNMIYAIRYPEIFYFPFSPKFSFSLLSDKGNAVEATLTTIDIPSDKDPENFQLNWTLKLNLDKQNIVYYLRMNCDTNGDIYLSEMKDAAVRRSFFSDPLIFPIKISYNSPISIGEKISLKYIKSLSTLTIKEKNKVFNNVVVANLNFGDDIFILYFSKGLGVVAIKTDDELFITK
jgi:hypothetical protein